MATSSQQLSDYLRVERAALVGDTVERVEELSQVSHSVLEQVSDAVRPVRQQFRCVTFLDVLRQDEHSDSRPGAAHYKCGPKSLVGKCRRHAHVDNYSVGLMRLDRPKKLFRATGGGHNLVPRLGQEAGKALA